jgi:prephenate dehydrogenase
MRIAVLGVGLIGGSIGLAARRRLGAEVTGFDPDPEILERALERDALDRAAGSTGEAVDGAEIVFCAAPVAELPALVAEAVDASGAGSVVTDVGSTKRELVRRLSRGAAAERFIGGHPLAGAETSGVDGARADLFEGARWYLTPTERSSGLLYDRLQRAIADLGARPQAIDAATHDRLMATVSHLPHVLANVLASQAAAVRADESERMPEVGRSFRDSTRVAGANPAIWADIFASNREAVAAEIDAVVERLREAGELLRASDPEAVRAWHRGALEDRRALLEGERVGGELVELRVVVQNRPGTVAEIALALGQAGVNIEDMALDPAADMRSGAITLWVAGADEAERAARIVGDLGHTVTALPGGE